MSSIITKSSSNLVVQSSIGRQTSTGSPLRIITAQESHQRRHIVHLAYTSRGRGRLDQRLHVLEELLVTLEPSICSR